MVADVETLESYLKIPFPESPELILDDSRRITGPGLMWEKPGAILDILIDGFDKREIIEAWEMDIKAVLSAIDWTENIYTSREFENGVSLAISAPMDLLYSAVFVIETSWHLAANRLLGEEALGFEKLISDLKEIIKLEENPSLISLQKAAKSKDIDVLCDDDFISLGHGKGSEVWPVSNTPSPDDVNWDALNNLPVALITGTNGKSTSVRLATAIAEAEGLTAGSTSTDFVKLGDDILDYGDYSGPGGARMLLRDKRLEIAFLEVARGGILRRGLPLTEAKAALVTNIAADHLGQYGVNTVESLAEAKFAVARTLSKNGVLVLNADDDLVVQNGLKAKRQVCWFSLNPDHNLIQKAKSENNICCWSDGESLHFFNGEKVTLSLLINNIPITMGGAAKFNIQNSMGALCLAKAMGVSNEAIKKGMCNFNSTPKDNPGRCNEFKIKGARIFVDFAHNPHSLEAIAEMLFNMPAKNKYLLIGQAGDRSDQDIKDLTAAALKFSPNKVVAIEFLNYLRGRSEGEVPALIKSEALKAGLPDQDFSNYKSPLEGTKAIMKEIKEGDIALLLALADRDQVFDYLNSL